MSKTKFPRSLGHDHDPSSIRKRLRKPAKESNLKDFVYGSIDGTVTTFAVVTGVVGAELSHQTILILGAANLLADGFSMAAGNFLATQSESDENQLIAEYESLQIEKNPEGEKQEVQQILEKRGYHGNLLKLNLEFITSDKARWVRTMLSGEYGIEIRSRSAIRAALFTFVAFVSFGSVPLLAYIFQINNPFLWTCILTGLSFFIVGSLQSIWSLEHWSRTALKTLAVGAIASTISYLVGALIRHLIEM